MRIRVGIRLRLDGDEGEKDAGISCRSPRWSRRIHEGRVSGLQAEDTKKHRLIVRAAAATACCGAAAATSNASAADASITSSTGGRTAAPAASETSSTGSEDRLFQREQNAWHNVADFWYFADPQNVPTIGSLKQGLLQSVLLQQGMFSLLQVSPSSAAILRNVARDLLLCDALWPSGQSPILWSRTAPQVVLQLHGAILPDDQPLHLLEKDDHVELCISSSSVPHVTADSTATAAAGGALYAHPDCEACMRPSGCSCLPLNHSMEDALDFVCPSQYSFHIPLASHKEGYLAQRGSSAGSCGSGICGSCCGKAGCSTTEQRNAVLRRQRRRTHTTSVTASLQHHVDKRRRIHEKQSQSSMPYLERQMGDTAAQLPPASVIATTGGSSSAQRRMSTHATQKIMKHEVHPSCESVTETGASVDVSAAIHRVRLRSRSSHNSTSCTSSRNSSSNSRRGLGENGDQCERHNRRYETQRRRLRAARRGGRRVFRVLSVSKAAATTTAQTLSKDHVVSSDAVSSRIPSTIGGPSTKTTPAGSQRRKKCILNKRASGRKNAQNATTAITGSAGRSKSAAFGRRVAAATAAAPVRSILLDVQRPPTVAPDVAAATAARRPHGIVSIRESSSEEDSGSEEDSSSEGSASEERVSTEEKREGVVRGGAAAAAATEMKTAGMNTLKQHKQQARQATKKTTPAATKTRTDSSSSSEESSSSTSSSEDITSSSSEEDEDAVFRGTSTGMRNIRGRMPAAVAQAAGVSIVPRRVMPTSQQNEKKIVPDKEWNGTKESPASGPGGCLHQPQSERAAVESAVDSSGSRSCPTACAGGERNAVTTGAKEVDKDLSLREQGRYAKEKWSPRQQQEGTTRQQQQQQQEKQRHPLQPQYEQEQNTGRRGPSWQVLSFKPWADPSLTAVQAGQWLRTRLLRLAEGMPTLDAWKTVLVEATDVPAGRIKLWELHQRGPLRRQGQRPGENSSNDTGIDQKDGQPSDEEYVVRVPCGILHGRRKGGAGRWIDWSELAYICIAATGAEEGHTEKSALNETGVAPAAASITEEASAAGLPVAATTSSDEGDKTGHKNKECLTELSRRADAPGSATAKTGGGSEGVGVRPAEMTPQRPAEPLRYHPRRLLSMRHQFPSAATSESATSEHISSTENHKGTIESHHRSSLQPGSPVTNSGINVSQNNHSVTLLLKENTGEVDTVANGMRRECTHLAACKSLLQHKTPVPLERNGCGDPHVAPPPSFSERETSDNGAAPARDTSSKIAGDVCMPAAAGETGVEQGNVDDGDDGKASETHEEVSAADRDEAEWEVLVNSKLEIFLDDDGEAVLASHPAAPTASLHLPLPRDVVVECSRRLEAARHNRSSTRNHRTHSEANGASISNGEHRNTATSEVCAQVKGAETDEVQLCTEEEAPSQQQPSGEGCTKIGVGLGEDNAEKTSNVLTDGTSSSINGRTKRIIGEEDLKGFECVKACARRVVGEQLQHIRRALRRQVDYYFSPVNWQRDTYLRSRAVPLSSTCYNNSGAASSSSHSSSTSCVAAEEAPAGIQGQTETSSPTTAEASRHVAVTGPTAADPRFNCAEAQERVTVAHEADTETLAVNLDDIMVFPRMRGLSRDRDFVAWCIKAGGGLHHVRLERRGETYWLVRNKRAESKRQDRTAAKKAAYGC